MDGRRRPAEVHQLGWIEPTYLSIHWPEEQLLASPHEEILRDEFMQLMFCSAYGLCGIDLIDFVGHSVRMEFNLAFLQEALRAMSDDTTVISFQIDQKGSNPIKIVEGNFIHIVMPMNLDGAYARLESPE